MVRFEKAFGGSDLGVHFITVVNSISERGKWTGRAAGLHSGSSAGVVTAHAPHCNLKSLDLLRGLVSHTHHILGTGRQVWEPVRFFFNFTRKAPGTSAFEDPSQRTVQGQL